MVEGSLPFDWCVLVYLPILVQEGILLCGGLMTPFFVAESSSCRMTTVVKDGRVISIIGDEDDPYTGVAQTQRHPGGS